MLKLVTYQTNPDGPASGLLLEFGRIAYEAYSHDHKFEKPNPEGLFLDKYDHLASTSHCLVQHVPSGTYVGVVRMILMDADGGFESLPLHDELIVSGADFSKDVQKTVQQNLLSPVGEVSRFCLSYERIRKLELSSREVVRCLVAGTMLLARIRGVRHYVSFCDYALTGPTAVIDQDGHNKVKGVLQKYGVWFVNFLPDNPVFTHNKKERIFAGREVKTVEVMVESQSPATWQMYQTALNEIGLPLVEDSGAPALVA